MGSPQAGPTMRTYSVVYQKCVRRFAYAKKSSRSMETSRFDAQNFETLQLRFSWNPIHT